MKKPALMKKPTLEDIVNDHKISTIRKLEDEKAAQLALLKNRMAYLHKVFVESVKPLKKVTKLNVHPVHPGATFRFNNRTFELAIHTWNDRTGWTLNPVANSSCFEIGTPNHAHVLSTTSDEFMPTLSINGCDGRRSLVEVVAHILAQHYS